MRGRPPAPRWLRQPWATLVTDLITGLRDRGLDVTRPVLAVLDGAKALSRAVKDVSDKPLIQRCQQHKIKNVRDKLPGKLRAVAEKRMRQAYHAGSAIEAEGLLAALARELDKTHPGAAASRPVQGHDRSLRQADRRRTEQVRHAGGGRADRHRHQHREQRRAAAADHRRLPRRPRGRGRELLAGQRRPSDRR